MRSDASRSESSLVEICIPYASDTVLDRKSTNLNMADGSNHRDGYYDRFCASFSVTVVNHVTSSRVQVYKRDPQEIFVKYEGNRTFSYLSDVRTFPNI